MACAALVTFALLLASTEWVLLAAVSGWLAAAWALSKPDPEPVRAGLVFAAILAGGALAFSLGGGLGLDEALRRAARAALLVAAATWLRAAARAAGLREVSRRALGRLRRVPSAVEAAAVLDAIAAEGRLAAAGRSLTERVSTAANRPLPFLDAVLDWVMSEAEKFRPAGHAGPLPLNARPRDWGLVATATLPALALFLA